MKVIIMQIIEGLTLKIPNVFAKSSHIKSPWNLRQIMQSMLCLHCCPQDLCDKYLKVWTWSPTT